MQHRIQMILGSLGWDGGFPLAGVEGQPKSLCCHFVHFWEGLQLSFNERSKRLLNQQVTANQRGYVFNLERESSTRQTKLCEVWFSFRILQ